MSKMSLWKLPKKVTFPWTVFLTALLVCSGGSFHFGYHLTVLNPPQSVFRDFLNQTHHAHYGQYTTDESHRLLWTVVISSMAIGGLFGTLPLVKLSEKFGRRNTFYVSSVFIMLGLFCQTVSKLASSYEVFSVGRFLVGFGTGLGVPLEAMYLTEISPLEYRGFITSIVGIFVQLGFLMGGVMGLSEVFGTETKWSWMFVVEMPLVINLMIMLPFLHESPRYLYSRGLIDECKRALVFFNRRDIPAELKELETEVESQKNRLRLKEIWTKVYLRRATFLCSAVVLVACFSGITYLEFFSTQILISVGLPESFAQYAMVMMFGPSVIAALFGSCIIEKVGRRPLLLGTTSVLILMNIALMALALVYDSFKFQWAGYLSVAVCIVFCLVFGTGPALLQWSIASEMTPQNARSAVQFVVMMVQRVAAIVAIAAFYPLQGLIGSYVFLIYIIPLCVFFCVFIPMFPETKKKNVVEIMKSLGYEDEDASVRSESSDWSV